MERPACQHCGLFPWARKLTEGEADELARAGHARTGRQFIVREGLLLCWSCKNAARTEGRLRNLKKPELVRPKIRLLRRAGMTQQAIADNLGISLRSVQRHLE